MITDPRLLVELALAALEHPAVASDARIVARLAQLAPRPAPAPASVAEASHVMSREAYAEHAGISVRKLDYLRADMTEGLHFRRVGRRVQFFADAADAFLNGRAASNAPAPANDWEADYQRRLVKTKSA